MKTLSFRRVSLIIGLAVGIMVLWAAAAPSAMGADSIIGGDWFAIPLDGSCACDGQGSGGDPCSGGYWDPELTMWIGCTSGDIVICYLNTEGWGGCVSAGDAVCDGNPACPSFDDTDCD